MWHQVLLEKLDFRRRNIDECAKASDDETHRNTLGYHVRGKSVSVVTYSWDYIVGALGALVDTLARITDALSAPTRPGAVDGWTGGRPRLSRSRIAARIRRHPLPR